MMPREHGSWAVLIAPILVGTAAAGGGPAGVMTAFGAAALGAFLLRTPLQSVLSPHPAPGSGLWLSAYLGLAAAGGLPLFLVHARWGLIGFAVPAAVLMAMNLRANQQRQTFSFSNEVLGILGLCLGAPAAFDAARGSLAGGAWWAWTVCALYFLGPIFDVKAAALRHRVFVDRSVHGAWLTMKKVSLVYAASVVLLVAAAAAAGWVPAAVPLPFLASLYKTWSRGRLAPGRVDFKRLGFEEVGYTVFFAVLAGAGFLARAG